MIIDSVRVDMFDIHWGKNLVYSWHFNCFDADDRPLPGMGGFVKNDVVVRRPEWEAAAIQLVANAKTLAQKWVTDYDEYESKSITLAEVNVKRYRGGGHGMAFRYYRDDDPFVAGLLLTHRNPDGPARFNQKLDVRDPVITATLDADIEQLMTQAEVLTLTINKTRRLKRRFNHGKK